LIGAQNPHLGCVLLLGQNPCLGYVSKIYVHGCLPVAYLGEHWGQVSLGKMEKDNKSAENILLFGSPLPPGARFAAG